MRPVGRLPPVADRHSRTRRLHGRGRALAARPRRRGRALLRGRRRAAAVRAGLAPEREVQGAEDRVRQQDGPRGRELLQRHGSDEEAARGEPRPDGHPDRLGGDVRRRHRPREDEGALLRHEVAWQDCDREGHSRGVRRAGEGMASEDGRVGGGAGRRADGEVFRGRGAHDRRDQEGDPQGVSRAHDHPRVLRHGVQGQGHPAAPRRGLRLPALPARRGRGRQPGQPRREARGQRRRAVLRACVQDHERPEVRRQDHLRARLFGHDEARRGDARLDDQQGAAHQPPLPHAREQAGAARRGQGRRHRRVRGPHRDAHGRHALRPRPSDHAGVDRLPGAGHLGRRQAEEPRRQREARRRAARARDGGPDLRRQLRPGDERDDHRRHGRALPRGHRRPPEARVQRRVRRGRAAGRVPRDDPDQGRERVQARQAVRRPRPVRARVPPPRAAGARQGLRARASSSSTRSRAA